MSMFGSYWSTSYFMFREQTHSCSHKMDQNMWQTIKSLDLLHSSHMWIQTILLCGKHSTTMQNRILSRLRLCWRPWRRKINIRRSFVHFWKSNICTNQLDVQESDDSVAQLWWIRDHIVGCWFVYGRFTFWDLVIELLGMTQRIPKPTQACTREPGVKTQITPEIIRVLDQNVDLSNIDQVPSDAHLSEE